MQCVILAAGNGTRLRPHTEIVPKQLLEINGRPILEYSFESLPNEISEVVLVVGWLGEKIKEKFGDEFLGRKIKYVHQTERLGTAHALSLCKDILVGKFAVMMGDDLYAKADMEKCLKHDLCLLAYPVSNPEDYAVMEMNDDGSLRQVVERPHNSKSNLVNTAFYILDKKFFDYPMVPKQAGSSEFGLPQTIVQMAKDRKIYVERASFWMPVNTEQELERARSYFAELKI